MVIKLNLFYRTFVEDYVVNKRGRDVYEPKECEVFPEFSDALGYLLRNYGGKKCQLTIDEQCREDHGEGLERRLKRTKIQLR
ncbi:hypothetical protein HOC13_00485 [Candidatus Woesearchaeota archaeon]|jgi:hypothetical protein|nr:hypothetical protein [Candidatus Woesearchaeota archaeon]